MILSSIDKESNGIVQDSKEKPQHKKKDSIDKVEFGVSKAKLN